MYEIVFTKKAIADIEKLDDSTRSRISQKLKDYSVTPFKFAHKLSDTKIGTYRFRIGDYRVVFDLMGEKIVILRIGNRRDIYR